MRKNNINVLLFFIIIFLCIGLIGCTQITSDKSTEPIKDNSIKNKFNENLCLENEDVLLRFNLVDSNKILSLCLGKEQPDYIVVRVGNEDNIELEFPKEKDDSWSKFTYSYYLRGGGVENEGMDLNYLLFENEGYKYEIFQEYTAKENVTYVGYKITEITTNKEIIYEGISSSIEGSLVNLRDNNKIIIEIQ